MDAISRVPLHEVAQNYLDFLADFPARLAPEHLAVPASEQASLLEGLATLHSLIRRIYEHFCQLAPGDKRWENLEACYQAIEAPVKFLWVMGAYGQLARGEDGFELRLSRESLDSALKKCGCKDPVKALGVLETAGFQWIYAGAEGLPGYVSYQKCSAVAMRYPPQNDPLLRALAYYAARLPQKKSGRKVKGPIYEVFYRADFRPLLPGYSFHEPHLPATEEEVTRTFRPETLAVWNGLTGYMAEHYPQYRLYFRVPFPRGRRWVADYSLKDRDYGLWSIFVDGIGLTVRIVLIGGTIHNMLAGVEQLSPGFQENYLNAVACKDCSHCGKHVFYTHQDHVHRLCKSPWFISPTLHLADLPDIERLVDFRLASRE
jgi:hypothetical protein